MNVEEILGHDNELKEIRISVLTPEKRIYVDVESIQETDTRLYINVMEGVQFPLNLTSKTEDLVNAGKGKEVIISYTTPAGELLESKRLRVSRMGGLINIIMLEV